MLSSFFSAIITAWDMLALEGGRNEPFRQWIKAEY